MLTGMRGSKHILGAGITALCLVIFFQQVDFDSVVDALNDIHWIYVILGIVSLGLGYVFRIIRWSLMLRSTGANMTFANCCAPFLASIALNNVLPFRLGDVVRSLVFPKSMGISRTISTSSLVMERLFDLMTILSSLAIGLFAIRSNSVPEELIISAVSLTTAGVVALVAIFVFSGLLSRYFAQLSDEKSHLAQFGLARIFATLAGLLKGFKTMSRPRVMLSMLMISLLVWAFEAGLFFFMLVGSGMEATPIMALLIMAIATLSTIVPSSPGYVGPFHLAAYAAILLVGGSVAQAGSYAIIVHLGLWLPTTLAGALSIWMSPGLYQAARTHLT